MGKVVFVYEMNASISYHWKLLGTVGRKETFYVKHARLSVSYLLSLPLEPSNARLNIKRSMALVRSLAYIERERNSVFTRRSLRERIFIMKFMAVTIDRI